MGLFGKKKENVKDEKTEETLFVDGMIFRFKAIDKVRLPDGFLEVTGILEQLDSPSIKYDSEKSLVEIKFDHVKHYISYDNESVKKINDYFINNVIESLASIGKKYELIESGAIFNVQGVQTIMFFKKDTNFDNIYGLSEKQLQYMKETILKQQK